MLANYDRPSGRGSVVGDGISDPGATSVSLFHAVPLPENIADDNKLDSEFALIRNQRTEAPAVHPEKISVSLFDGTRGTFEHWITNVEYHLTQTRLIHSDEATLCQFLITHLRSGTAPEMMISADRKARKISGNPPKTFLLEISTLRKVFKESDDPQ